MMSCEAAAAPAPGSSHQNKKRPSCSLLPLQQKVQRKNCCCWFSDGIDAITSSS